MKKQLSVILSLLLLLSVLLTGCAKEVAVDASGLQNLTLNGEAVASGSADYSATLTPADGYMLPATITVNVGGTALTSGYTYDATTGALTIEASAITGDIAVSGTAAESLVGTWHATKDISDLLTQMLAETDPTTSDYFTFSDLNLVFTMTLGADGSFTLVSTADDFADTLLEQMRPGLEKMLEEALADANLDMTLEEFLSVSGTSLDALLDELAATLSFDDELEAMNISAKYIVEGDKLYFSEDMDSEIDMDEATTFTLVDGVLSFVAISGNDDAAEELAELLPLVFNRVN